MMAKAQYMIPFPHSARPLQKMTQVTRPSPQRPSPQRLVPAPSPQRLVPALSPQAALAPAVRPSPQAAVIKAERVKPQTTSPHNTLVTALSTSPASSVTTIMGQGGIPIYPQTKAIQRPLATRPVPYQRVVPTNTGPSNPTPGNARFMTSSTINMTSQITVSTRCSAFLPVQYEMC